MRTLCDILRITYLDQSPKKLRHQSAKPGSGHRLRCTVSQTGIASNKSFSGLWFELFPFQYPESVLIPRGERTSSRDVLLV